MDGWITAIIAIASALLGGGISSFITARSTSSKTKNDIGASNIDVALKLRDEAVKQYDSAEEKLKKCQKLIDEVQAELDCAMKYVAVLQHILEENDIDFPKYDCPIKHE